MFRIVLGCLAALFAAPALAANLAQTVHFPGASAGQLFDLYATTAGHAEVTGLPASYVSEEGAVLERAAPGATLTAFCFQPEQCALGARVLDISSVADQHTIALSWWNFGWVSAVDKKDLRLEGRGAPDSIAILTFRDTHTGAQIELVQVNVPDYKVNIPNPDGSVETGPLSAIVNTHWNVLYWDGFRRVLAQ